MNLKHDVRAIAREFEIHGEFISAGIYGSGHINDTYCVVFEQAGARGRYIFQRVNHLVFKNPVALMENIARVTRHLGGKFTGTPDAGRRALTLLPARDGKPFQRDAAGNCWRVYWFIGQARTFDAVESPA